MKRLCRIGMLTVVFTLIVTMSAYAAGIGGLDTKNIGVSTEIPEYYGESEDSYGDITPFGLGKPPKSKVVNLNNGQMDFAGVAATSTLYTPDYSQSHHKPLRNCIKSIKNSQSIFH